MKALAGKIQPIYGRSAGKDGYVSIQGGPVEEHGPQSIIRHGLANRELGENICIKAPVTASGLAAVEALLAKDVCLST
jgi:transaldolase